MALNQKKGITNQRLFSWVFIGIIFSLFIGWRHEVGGDWFNYIRNFNNTYLLSVSEIFYREDPGYYLLNWFMADWGYQMYAVNLICGIIFVYGLMVFARSLDNSWLAYAVAYPYLTLVVAMGYTRQGVALGLIFLSLTALNNGRFKRFLFFVILAATFHKTAVLMIGLGVFLHGSGKWIRFLAVMFVGYGIWNAFVADHQVQLWNTYVSNQMQSQGALIRVSMNFLPSVLFILLRKKWKEEFADYSLWYMMAIGSIISILLVSIASTAIDRIALYFTPIQVVVFSRLPILIKHKYNPKTVILSILAFYFLVLFVWLTYATHSKYWIPYKNLIFEV